MKTRPLKKMNQPKEYKFPHRDLVMEVLYVLPDSVVMAAYSLMQEKYNGHRAVIGKLNPQTHYYDQMLDDRWAEVYQCLRNEYGHLIN